MCRTADGPAPGDGDRVGGGILVFTDCLAATRIMLPFFRSFLFCQDGGLFLFSFPIATFSP